MVNCLWSKRPAMSCESESKFLCHALWANKFYSKGRRRGGGSLPDCLNKAGAGINNLLIYFKLLTRIMCPARC